MSEFVLWSGFFCVVIQVISMQFMFMAIRQFSVGFCAGGTTEVDTCQLFQVLASAVLDAGKRRPDPRHPCLQPDNQQ